MDQPKLRTKLLDGCPIDVSDLTPDDRLLVCLTLAASIIANKRHMTLLEDDLLEEFLIWTNAKNLTIFDES